MSRVQNCLAPLAGREKSWRSKPAGAARIAGTGLLIFILGGNEAFADILGANDSFADAVLNTWSDADWSVAIGGGVEATTSIYTGDDDVEFAAVPHLSARWRQLEIEPDRLALTFWETDTLSVDLSANLRAGPDFPETAVFAGLQRDIAVELGGSVSYDWGGFSTGFSFHHDVAGAHSGYEAVFDVARDFEVGEAIVDLGLGATVQDKNLGSYLYGVTAAEANAYRAAYAPDISVSPFVEASVAFPITDHFAIVGFAEYQLLDKTIQNSPLVDASDTALMGLFMVFQF